MMAADLVRDRRVFIRSFALARAGSQIAIELKPVSGRIAHVEFACAPRCVADLRPVEIGPELDRERIDVRNVKAESRPVSDALEIVPLDRDHRTVTTDDSE